MTTTGAHAPRDAPSTHSTYAVTDSRLGRSDSFLIVSRELLIGSYGGTNCRIVSDSWCAVWSNRLNPWLLLTM